MRRNFLKITLLGHQEENGQKVSRKPQDRSKFKPIFQEKRLIVHQVPEFHQQQVQRQWIKVWKE